ncbi:MAG TPA: glycine oxidase ThiO [Gemmataceae bacterium]|nr:glycine oxidase ThiO [Gemmataceae bacterium]
MEQADVLIIGGGVIGLTTAYFLVGDGVGVQVVDKGDFGQEASWAGAGILPPGNLFRARTPIDQLRALSADRFPALSAELRERTGIDNGYLRCGGLEVVRQEDEAAVNEWRSEGIAFELLPEKELRRLEPALAPGLRAYHLPDMAQLRNPRHLKALLAGCESLGVRLRPGCLVQGFERRGDRIIAARVGDETIEAEQFLVTAGAWTDALLERVGWRPGVRPVRGQIALLNTGRPLFRRILLDGARYLVPRPDGRVLVGSTEEDVGFDKRTTAGAIADLLGLAGALVPRLADAHLERCWAGLRPGSPDGLPFLGPVPGISNLFVAAGHFRAGIQLSPATGLVMKELLTGRLPSVPLESFSLDRQPAAPHCPAFRS